MDKQEFMERLKTARTWPEVQVRVQEAYEILANDTGDTGNSTEVSDLQKRIDTLTDTVKKLRAENKQLKGR